MATFLPVSSATFLVGYFETFPTDSNRHIVGTAGIEAVGKKDKVKHRAEFGISIEKGFWGIGIGHALTVACVECAKAAGYTQLELNVVSENRRAISLYESIGFREYGRNPKGFCSRKTGWQEIVLMRMELDCVYNVSNG